LAYDQAKKFSADRDTFGTGNPTGVIAAESANNAMVGPSLVPLLTLSIPGSPTAAVLLGGLLIHGIFPGPDLFTNHPQVAWTFINSMLIGQILMVIFGLYIAGYGYVFFGEVRIFSSAAGTGFDSWPYCRGKFYSGQHDCQRNRRSHPILSHRYT